MPLKLRTSGLGSGTDKDRPDYVICTGEWEVGRIYQTRGGPDSLRWFWSMNANGPMTRSDRVATLKEAKAQFQKSWDAWKAWAKLKELSYRRVSRGPTLCERQTVNYRPAGRVQGAARGTYAVTGLLPEIDGQFE